MATREKGKKKFMRFFFQTIINNFRPIKSGNPKGSSAFVKKARSPPQKAVQSKVTDARLKLIKKNRVTIRDARERITESQRSTIKDARELLSSKKREQHPAEIMMRKALIPRSRGAHFSMDEELLVDDMDMDVDNFKTKPLASLKRTVQNDIYRHKKTSTTTPPRMPRLPTFSIANNNIPSSREDSPDPFDCYKVPTRRPLIPPPPLPRSDCFQAGRVMSAHMDAYDLPRKSILRQASSDHDDRFESDRYIVAEPRAHYSHADSQGLFANVSMRRPSPPPITPGYKIIVHNLNPTISEGEIRELFEDIGVLLSARMIRTGCAEVCYESKGDAEVAMETYHNRYNFT